MGGSGIGEGVSWMRGGKGGGGWGEVRGGSLGRCRNPLGRWDGGLLGVGAEGEEVSDGVE